MRTLTRHWKRWSGWYVYLAAVFAWLTLLGVCGLNAWMLRLVKWNVLESLFAAISASQKVTACAAVITQAFVQRAG